MFAVRNFNIKIFSDCNLQTPSHQKWAENDQGQVKVRSCVEIQRCQNALPFSRMCIILLYSSSFCDVSTFVKTNKFSDFTISTQSNIFRHLI